MSESKGSFKPEETMECAREAVREQIVFPVLARAEGGVVEVNRRSVDDFYLQHFLDVDEYRSALLQPDPKKKAPCDGDSAQNPAFGLWLFGPERAENPAGIYRCLAESLADGATVMIASEVPWPGKILSAEEVAEYTAEETSASLIRAGFVDIDRLVEGPFFRIWKATKSDSSAHTALILAEEFLSKGDFVSAERELETITDQMDSALVVREFALLVAACHDLAGRRVACMDALSEALLLDPRCARAMCGLGRISALNGDLDSATEFFDAALRYEPALVAALHGKAVVQEAGGDLEGAFTAMMTASDLRPKNDAFLNETSRLGNMVGRLDEVARFISHRFSQPGFGVSEAAALESVMASEQN
jgi:Flp pilus assembly protein TadD